MIVCAGFLQVWRLGSLASAIGSTRGQHQQLGFQQVMKVSEKAVLEHGDGFNSLKPEGLGG
jgi:hypothetical protein